MLYGLAFVSWLFVKSKNWSLTSIPVLPCKVIIHISYWLSYVNLNYWHTCSILAETALQGAPTCQTCCSQKSSKRLIPAENCIVSRTLLQTSFERIYLQSQFSGRQSFLSKAHFQKGLFFFFHKVEFTPTFFCSYLHNSAELFIAGFTH